MRAILDEDGYTICNPSPMGGSTARLIAAAPLLLDALHAALDDIDAQRAEGIEPPAWYWQARNAIAKTEE